VHTIAQNSIQMSRGRGRGRGGGRGGGSITQDLLRDNLEDLGFDNYQQYPDNTPPPLYPPLILEPPVPLSDNDLIRVEKMRELSLR
jgi:hypothetical protein